jgi:hypothetical protein
MSGFVVWRNGAWSGEGYVGLRGEQEVTTEGRRDKSPCPKRCKSLTRLAFWRAWRSVAYMLHGFFKQFQSPSMHASGFLLAGAAS